jgi:hypothetical protein
MRCLMHDTLPHALNYDTVQLRTYAYTCCAIMFTVGRLALHLAKRVLIRAQL